MESAVEQSSPDRPLESHDQYSEPVVISERSEPPSPFIEQLPSIPPTTVVSQLPPTVVGQPPPTVVSQPPPTVVEQPPPTVVEQPPPTVVRQPPPTVVEQPPPTNDSPSHVTSDYYSAAFSSKEESVRESGTTDTQQPSAPVATEEVSANVMVVFSMCCTVSSTC